MSAFPDFLYRLTPRDEQVTPLEIVSNRLYGAAIASVIASSGVYVVPTGKILVLSSFWVQTIAGAAQTALHSSVIIQPNNSLGNAAEIWGAGISGASAAASTTTQGNSPSEIYLPQGCAIYASAAFSAGAAANTCNFSFVGVLIPRGNFAV